MHKKKKIWALFLLVFKKTLPLTPSNGIKYENVSCMKCVGIYSTIVVDESYSTSLIDLLSVIWKRIQHNQWRSVALISRRCSGIMWVDFHRILSFFLGLWDDGEWLQKTVSGLLSVPVQRSGTVFVFSSCTVSTGLLKPFILWFAYS